MMSIFQHPNDENTICQVLRAYAEEWGPEYITVSVPKKWQGYGVQDCGKCKLEYATNDTVVIRAEQDNTIKVTYSLQLATV